MPPSDTRNKPSQLGPLVDDIAALVASRRVNRHRTETRIGAQKGGPRMQVLVQGTCPLGGKSGPYTLSQRIQPTATGVAKSV